MRGATTCAGHAAKNPQQECVSQVLAARAISIGSTSLTLAVGSRQSAKTHSDLGWFLAPRPSKPALTGGASGEIMVSY